MVVIPFVAPLLGALTSRAGLIGLALIGGFAYGHHVATVKSDAQALRLQVATLTASITSAERQNKILQGQQVELQEAVDDYKRDLEARDDGNSCRLGRADVERLRALLR
jgi:hypothetical protein